VRARRPRRIYGLSGAASSFFVARVSSCSVTGTLDDYERLRSVYDSNVVRISPRSCSATGYTAAAIRIVIGAPAGVRVAGRYAACSLGFACLSQQTNESELARTEGGGGVPVYLLPMEVRMLTCSFIRHPAPLRPPDGHPRGAGAVRSRPPPSTARSLFRRRRTIHTYIYL